MKCFKLRLLNVEADATLYYFFYTLYIIHFRGVNSIQSAYHGMLSELGGEILDSEHMD